jgi:hypothetical protein
VATFLSLLFFFNEIEKRKGREKISLLKLTKHGGAYDRCNSSRDTGI